jgi:hypothetical protein
MKVLFSIVLSVLLYGALARAESPAPGDQSAVLGQESGGDLTSVGELQSETRAKLLQKLSAKLLNHKGQPVSVVVFSPIDFTTTQVGPIVSSALVESLKKYGNLNVREEKYVLENLTLGEFRKGMAEFKVDVLVASSIRNTNFDIYIYDRRTPYYIYAHSEPIPEVTQLQISQDVAQFYSRIMLRRALYRYINDQYFELPRQDSAPVLQSEIPRWIASPESLSQINRELVSNLYFGVSSGAIFTRSSVANATWNASLLGLQFGYRVHGNLFVEGAFENSAYNVFIGSMKYVLVNRNSPFRIGIGLGAAYATAKKVLVVDNASSLAGGGSFVVGSFSFLFPIGDVYLKLENRNFIGLGSGGKAMFTLMPGLLIHF